MTTIQILHFDQGFDSAALCTPTEELYFSTSDWALVTCTACLQAKHAALVNYTVRNITTGDEEDLRVLELSGEEILNGFPPEVAKHIFHLIRQVGYNNESSHETNWQLWKVQNSEIIRLLLLPYISDRALYDSDYEAWENMVLGEDRD